MTKPLVFNHREAYYYPILKEWFRRLGKDYTDYIKEDNEWKKTKEWFCNMNDFKLLIDTVNDLWEKQNEKNGKRSRKK